MLFKRFIFSYNTKAEKRNRDFVHMLVLIGYSLFSALISIGIRKQNLLGFDPPEVRFSIIGLVILFGALIYSKIFTRGYTAYIQFIFGTYTLYTIFLAYANEFDANYIVEVMTTSFVSCLFIRKRENLRIFLGMLMAVFSIVNVLHPSTTLVSFALNFGAILLTGFSILLFFEYKILSEKKFIFKDNLFSSIFNQTSDSLILISNENSLIITCNNQALKLLNNGSPVSEVNERPLLEFIRPTGQFKNWDQLFQYILIDHNPWIETEFKLKESNKTIWARVSVTRMQIESLPYLLLTIIDVTELVNKEILLEQNKEMLTKVINLLPHQIYLKDAQGKFILVNDTVLKAQNKTLAQIQGKTDFDFFTKEQAEGFKKIEDRIIASGESLVIPEEYNYDQQGNLVRILYTTKIPFFLPEKNETGILGVNIDITENKLAEKTIRENEAKYKTLLEQASDGIYLADDLGNIIDANTKACEMFGYSKEEFLHKNILSFTNPELEKNNVARLIDNSKQNILIERTFLKKDNTQFTVEMSARLLENGGHQAILRDITERKKLDALLQENERKFRALIENSSDMIVILNQENYITYISPSALKILNYPEKRILGLSTIAIVHKDDMKLYEEFLRNIKDNPGKNFYLNDIRIKKTNKEYRYVELVGVNLLTDNVIKGIIINFHDVSERKNTEIQLLNSNFELDSFVYRASHDMKAPLRSIIGLINLTKQETKGDKNLLEYLNMMEISIVKLDNFLKDLTSFVRNTRIEISPEEINFEEVINESLNSLKFIENAHNIAIVKNLDLKSSFFSDSGRISTIINNLLSNSFKYHKNILNESYIKINVAVDKKNATIVIEDNGNGIDKKYQSKIFEMFYRASEKSYGSGLGLYIVKMAVQKLNGTIDLLSEPGEKTIFTVVIPNINK